MAEHQKTSTTPHSFQARNDGEAGNPEITAVRALGASLEAIVRLNAESGRHSERAASELAPLPELVVELFDLLAADDDISAKFPVSVRMKFELIQKKLKAANREIEGSQTARDELHEVGKALLELGETPDERDPDSGRGTGRD